ncbi:ABC transporter permease [Galbitalea soli]|uniref:ABC transporter permease n=1 Tax=Galbitalea soli TaxID=1268042 RepID=A0A7C9TRA0_9MICO|nr:ABC transporter permease [Galbitalea soli]NEM91501.1 ABC transporter permease [Galbitalea soli]NYJ30194.1 simple sugar transport system permease protein [Galbitalea soli]
MTGLTFWAVVIAGAFSLCAPIVLAGLGEIFLERAGGFNVGIEGMMLMGAVFGVIGSLRGGFWAGALEGILAGAVFGLLLGLATAFGKADMIIVGVAIGLLGAGLSTYLFQALNPAGQTNETAPTQPILHLDALTSIPLIGPGLANAGMFFYLSVFLSIVAWWVMKHTRFGLRLRAVGDDEVVATTRGIPVRAYRLIAAIIAGGLAGLGGAAVALSSIGSFTPGMTGGTGFIALAVVIIAGRSPLGLLGGALLFALFNSLALLAQTKDFGLPVEIFEALPYLVTVAILCVVSRYLLARSKQLGRRRSAPPASSGIG